MQNKLKYGWCMIVTFYIHFSPFHINPKHQSSHLEQDLKKTTFGAVGRLTKKNEIFYLCDPLATKINYESRGTWYTL